jgi:hypothetical protein
MSESALATAGAIIREDNLVLGVPLGHRFDQFEGQLGSSALVRIGLTGFVAPLLPFDEFFSVAV